MFFNSMGRNCMLYLVIILPPSRTKIGYFVTPFWYCTKLCHKRRLKINKSKKKRKRKKKSLHVCLFLIKNEVYYFEFDILPAVLRK